MIRSPRMHHRLPLLAAVVALSLVAACTPPSGDAGTVAPPPSSTAPSVSPASPDATPGTPEPIATPEPSGGPTSGPTPTASPSPARTTIVRAYFFLGSFTGDGGLAPVLRTVPETKAVATAAMEALLAGPSAQELGARPAMYTAVPDGTRLLGLRVENGIAIVNLSREFESGGGSMSIFGRLAQVVYTLTQFPTVEGVSFELDGQPVTVFSGEGVVFDGPVSRADYRDDQLAEIFVDRPAWGAAAGNPVRVTGLTRVFEATFQVQVIDAQGTVLVSEVVTATCGTGCWGDFDVTLRYDVGSSQWGTLRVFDYSPKDGNPENVTDYPVWLMPQG